MHLDWLNGVEIPAVLAVITVVGLYLRDPSTAELRNPTRFLWSAMAAGVVWAAIRGIYSGKPAWSKVSSSLAR